MTYQDKKMQILDDLCNMESSHFHDLDWAEKALDELVKGMVIGELSRYPSHYTISDVLHDQRQVIDKGEVDDNRNRI